MAASPGGLPFHVAHKSVPHIGPDGSLVSPAPDARNAVKFERFIFDLLPAALEAIVVEVDAAEAFAPVKNASGAAKDSPESVQRQMVSLHRRWLQAAGADVPPGVNVEIRPLFALDAEETAARLALPCRVERAMLFE
jgi:UDP-N-acetylglucosamine/UDP-N-acetylgalactosamine diphosphorylase